jgi:hypothetical protein
MQSSQRSTSEATRPSSSFGAHVERARPRRRGRRARRSGSPTRLSPRRGSRRSCARGSGGTPRASRSPATRRGGAAWVAWSGGHQSFQGGGWRERGCRARRLLGVGGAVGAGLVGRDGGAPSPRRRARRGHARRAVGEQRLRQVVVRGSAAPPAASGACAGAGRPRTAPTGARRRGWPGRRRWRAWPARRPRRGRGRAASRRCRGRRGRGRRSGCCATTRS